jgi:hypothetical protein
MTDHIDNGEAQRFEAEYEATLEREADEALDRIQRGQSWLDWVKVAQLFAHGRKLAMFRGHANKPEGKGYNLCFSAWLDAHPKLRAVDKATRNHAMQCIDQLDAIEAWRATLAENQRQTINHPTTVLRRFKSANRDPSDAAPAKPKKVQIGAEELDSLHSELATLKKAADADDRDWFYEGTPEQLAAICVRKNKNRSAKLYAALGRELHSDTRSKKPAKA